MSIISSRAAGWCGAGIGEGGVITGPMSMVSKLLSARGCEGVAEEELVDAELALATALAEMLVLALAAALETAVAAEVETEVETR